MAAVSQNNRKIAINTVYLYIRKIITIVIGLYSSRILLKALGIDDFGLYGLIGSVVLLFTSLRSGFVSSVQRFITVSLSTKDSNEIRKVFSIGLRIHIIFAFFFVLIAIIGGLLILPMLNIPEGSYSQAQVVLILSVLSAAVTLITVPFDAVLIAYEKLNAFAYISIFEQILRLAIVFTLFIFSDYRIVYYSLLTLLVSILMRFVNSIYCYRCFGNIVKYTHAKDKSLVISMTKFAGWNFFGNIGYGLLDSGTNFILNIFGGVAINGARSIANQVMNKVMQFVGDLTTSFQSQTMLAYNEHETNKFSMLTFMNSKLGLYVFSILVFPLIVFTVPTLKLWLGEVPEFAEIFTQTILIYSLIRSLHGPIDLLFKAANKMKEYQLAEFFTFILNLPISYIALYYGAPYYWVFLIMSIIEVFNLCNILRIAKKILDFDIQDYLKKVILRILPYILILTLTFLTTQYINLINISYMATIGGLIIAAFYSAIIGFFTIFNHSERSKILSILKK